MGLEETDRRVAEELAVEIRTASGGPRTWRRVASLLEAFGVERLSEDVRERIATALAEASIEVHPPLAGVAREAMVQLALPDSKEFWTRTAELENGQRQRPVIAGTEWSAWGAVHELDMQERRQDGRTVWFDVDSSQAAPVEVLNELWPFCRNELTREMVEDLLEDAGRPGVRSYSDDCHIRLVCTFGMESTESNTGGTNASRAGKLVFRPVKLLAGSDWLITSWQRDPVGTAFADARAITQQRVEKLSTAPTPGDLGINVVYSVTRTYPSTARRLHAWLDAWEVDFHQALDGASTAGLADLEKSTLIDLRALLSDMRSRLHAFEQAGMAPNDAWLTGIQDGETPLHVRHLLSATLAELGELDEALRTSLELLMTASSAEQLAAAQAHAAQAERFNQLVAIVASVLLVPTFLAELFGTKPYPGGDGSWLHFALLLLAMAMLGTLTYRFLTRRRVR